MKSLIKIRTITFFILILSQTGCSVIFHNRGLVPNLSESTPKDKFKGGSRYFLRLTPNGNEHIVVEFKNKKANIEFYSNAVKKRLISIGPFLLPLIPWPPGIYNAIVKRSYQPIIPEELEITLQIMAAKTDRDVYFKPNFSPIAAVKPQIELTTKWATREWLTSTKPAPNPRPLKPLEKLTSVRDYFGLFISPLSSEIEKLEINAGALVFPDETVEIPTIVFTKGAGLSYNPGVIND